MRHAGSIRLALALALGAVQASPIAVAGCDGSGAGPEPEEWYFGETPGVSEEPCEGGPDPQDLRRVVRVRLFRGGVSDATLAKHTRALQRYFLPYGVRFRLAAAPVVLPYDAILDCDTARLGRDLAAAGIDIRDENLPPDKRGAAQAIVLDAVFARVRDFVALYGEPATDVVNVAVLARVASESTGALLMPFGEIAGLGISMDLLAEIEAEGGGALSAAIGLPAEFSPMLFVGDEATSGKDGDAVAQVIAHEMGHALGLQHTESPEPDLMAQGLSEHCLPYLTEDQMDKIARGLAGVADTMLAAIARATR
jgi:hypothetical protein